MHQQIVQLKDHMFHDNKIAGHKVYVQFLESQRRGKRHTKEMTSLWTSLCVK